ncbi:RHS repeat-associated core domain-containing protein [Paraburkholderia caribensis]|uniref:RHS repeat-associated core domain-containing protein n=1 Tax=Paraburkholderia caribensis TaxID=75105 RepID=UPI0034D32E4E
MRENPDDAYALPVAQRQHTLEAGRYQWRAASVYLYEPGTFVPLARLDETLEQAAYLATGTDGRFVEYPARTRHATYFYQNDHLGTPQELVDESGKVVWLGRYRAWGALRGAKLGDGAAETGNLIRAQGQYHDEELGLHYNRYRYYDPHAGRFISKDPIGLKGGVNVYQYASNPTGWIDPLGLACKCVPKCTDDTSQGPKGTTEMAQELSKQIGQNSVTFATPTTQGHIDLQDATHFDKATGVDIPTPHVQTRNINIGPGGQITTSKKTEVTRAASKRDVRVARELARRKGLCR